MKTFRVASWIFTKSLRFYTGGFGTLLQNGACLVGAVLLFIHYIDEKAIVQIIIRADLVLIAPHRYSLRLHKAQRYCCPYCENPLILGTPTNIVGPRNALNYVLGSSETMFFGIKPEKFRRRFLPYSYRFLPLPCCRPKKSKIFSGRKALSFSALPFSRNFFLKNNCENIWRLWKKSVILHSLNGTSGTPLTTATAKSSLKEIT